MKVAFYMTTVLEHPGGCEKYLIETAANLANRPGISADVITMDEDYTAKIGLVLGAFFLRKPNAGSHLREASKDVERRLGKAKYHKLHTVKELRAKLQSYDVIYSKNELIEGLMLRFLVGYHRLPPVVFGGHTPLRYPNASTVQAKIHNKLYGGLIYRFLASGVKKFHALNQQEEQLYKHLFPNKDVRKIYNPFDIVAFRKSGDRQQKGSGYNFDGGAINILWVGRLTEQKGVSELVQLVERVNRTVDDPTSIAWNICGDGELRSEIEALVSREANVQYFGRVDQADMPYIYSKSQILVCTSRWEGYPYSLIEPQAYGLQIFAIRIPGVEDIVLHYEGGFLAKDIEVLVQGLTDKVHAWRSPRKVPVSIASDQFEPSKIYSQLVDFMGVGGN